MTWRKYFKTANVSSNLSPLGNGHKEMTSPGYRNYQSNLPEVYVGHPNRIERYNQYESMDADSEVNAALDILAEFCTQENIENNTNFKIRFKEKPTDNEVKIIKEQLQQWVALNEFNKRMFKIFRNVLKYGDQVFIRDPETFKLYWTEMSKVTKVIVNESEGKEPEQYMVKDITPNFQNLTVTAVTTSDSYSNSPQIGGGNGGYIAPKSASGGGGRFQNQQNEGVINAEHIVHVSLTEGVDAYWPFGTSVLEHIFKVFKQKELLEDSIIIYRVQRAPERRMFKIDVGNMPSHMAMAFVDRIKNEIAQRRIPTQSGGGVNMMDATYNPLCLDLATNIPLLDGRTVSLSTLINEFNSGKENWAYSCDPDSGAIVPGVISWAGVTRKNAEVITITLDNGEKLTCTPDHKIPVFGKGFVEAKDLTEQDSLIAFNTQNKAISGGKTNEYLQVWDHNKKSWVWVHRMVAEYFKSMNKHSTFTYLPENIDKDKSTVHHKDSNRFNNDPRNLTFMNAEDHILYHSAQKAEFWESMTEEYRAAMTDKISETLKKRWKDYSPEERLVKLNVIRQAQLKAVHLRATDKEVANRYSVNISNSLKQHYSENPESLARVRKNLENRVHWKNQKLVLNFEMLQEVVSTVKTHSKKKGVVIKHCEDNPKLISMLKAANATNKDLANQSKIDLDKFGYSKIERLIKQFGYSGWKHFVNSTDKFNHRIVSVTKGTTMDVGTITIDGPERWHSHHTFAIASGIFVKNSQNEDFFFPVTADSRGSSVEVLPGGQNLGEITDLRFFTNKLFRGLRIPSSYLPTGADEGSATFNDGKVGTALIQEKRFNEYCKRLQRMVVDKLDQEFKMFMRWRGVNIDGSLFDLIFEEPQNFAAYAQADVDTARIATFTQLEAFPYFSKRWLMKRYLGLSEEEMNENEQQWSEEQGDVEAAPPGSTDLRSVGVTPGGIAGDLGNVTPDAPPTEPGAPGEAPPAPQPGAGASVTPGI